MEIRKGLLYLLLVMTFTACIKTQQSDRIIKNDLRAPAYPLITVHPDVSIWAVNDTLSAQAPRFFDRERDFPLVGAIRVDGVVYRFLGDEKLPLMPLAPISYEETWKGKYTFIAPELNWQHPHFDDSQWKTGAAAFGTGDQRNVKTLWPSHDIWVRREITLDKKLIADSKLYLRYSHDDVFQLFINGIPLVSTGYEWKNGVEVLIPDSIAKTMTEGKATIAAHCENRTGGALIDFGIYAEPKKQSYLDNIAIQESVDVQATQTHYTFQCGGVTLKLCFTAPQLMDDLELLSRPVNYISYQIASLDSKEHNAEIYFELASKKAFGAGQVEINKESSLLLLKMGNNEQKLWSDRDGFAPAWGYFYLGSEKRNTSYAIGDAITIREEFAIKGNLSPSNTTSSNLYVAITQSLNTSGKAKGHLLVGFDGLYTIEYFGENLRPYWNREEDHPIEEEMLQAHNEKDKVLTKASRFDHQLMVDALLAGGKEYAELCALAYRQAITPFQLSEAPNGDLLFFTKEVGPVDAYYPAASIFLRYNPKLMEAILNPIFDYSESGRWTKPYPAHDLGGYPVVNGQTHGGNMPIEEAGNMLILTATITSIENDASYAKKHWEVLSQWAGYLLRNGMDTGTQPCTDNFAGPCPHNANLSIKGILGLASYSYLAGISGQPALAQAYKKIVSKRAMEWEKKASSGTHYRIALAQDNDSTWSQKYNLVWDNTLGLNVFPDSISQKETAFYLTKLNKYGLPLDSKHEYAKTDWSIWAASLTKDREAFRKLIKPLHRFMHETPDRVPMSDLIHTEKNTREAFAARPVVGGIYIKMLQEWLESIK